MSGSELSEYIFTWRIKNYSAYNEVLGDHIVSPSFTIDNFPGSKWCLLLYPKNICGENLLELYLKWEALDRFINTVQISYRLDILDEASCTLASIDVNDKIFHKEDSYWGGYNFFDGDELGKKMNKWKDDILTLQCYLKIDKQSNVIGSDACTTIGIERTRVEWFVKIPSLSEYSDRIKFPFLDLFNLEITLNSKKEEVEILIHFDEVNCEESPQLTLKITVYNNTERKLGWKRDIHLCKTGETWTFPDFITREMLKSLEIDSCLYEFKLKCEISVPKNVIVSNYIERFEFASSSCIDSTPKDRPKSAMINDFRNLFKSKNYSDVTIRCESCDFPAHKLVLRLRSPVFAAMFDQDMMENNTDIVEILDSDEITIKSFLEYLYTDTVDEINYDIAKYLILTADKYQVPSLIDHCASFLKTEIYDENVLEIIAIADMIGYESLKSYALKFIKVNSAAILSSMKWSKLIEWNIKLSTYILSELSADIKESH